MHNGRFRAGVDAQPSKITCKQFSSARTTIGMILSERSEQSWKQSRLLLTSGVVWETHNVHLHP